MRQHRNDILSKNFSLALLKARGDRSQAEFARILGIPSQQTYQRYEKGLIPTGDVLHRIASCLSVTINDLLDGGGSQKPAVVEDPGKMNYPSDAELREQLPVVFSLIARNLDTDRIWKIVLDILGNRHIGEDSKILWIKLFGENSSAFSKLKPDEKQSLIRRYTSEASRKDDDALREFYQRRATPDGLIGLAAGEVIQAALVVIPIDSMRIKVSNGQETPVLHDLSADAREVLNWWARLAGGEHGIFVSPPDIRPDGTVSEAAMRRFRQESAQLAAEWPFDKNADHGQSGQTGPGKSAPEPPDRNS